MTIYDRIDFVRKEKGIKWGYINEKIGAYRGKLTEVKNGKTTLTQDELYKIAELLDTSIDYLLGNTDNPEPAIQKEKSPRTAEAAQGEELRDEIIHRAGELSSEQLDLFLALLRLTAARNQGLSAADLVSAGEAALKAELQNHSN